MLNADRTTVIGQMIDSYLRSDSELDDHVIHLLFSANRWELVYVDLFFFVLFTLTHILRCPDHP